LVEKLVELKAERLVGKLVVCLVEQWVVSKVDWKAET